MSSLTESVPNLKQRINQMQTQHTAELEKLYARQAAQYLDDALDRYAAQDDEANGDYSGVIDVCHFQKKFRGPPLTFASRSSIINRVMGRQASKPGSIARRHWCAWPTWRPLRHYCPRSLTNRGKKNRASGARCNFLSPRPNSTLFRTRNYNNA